MRRSIFWTPSPVMKKPWLGGVTIQNSPVGPRMASRSSLLQIRRVSANSMWCLLMEREEGDWPELQEILKKAHQTGDRRNINFERNGLDFLRSWTSASRKRKSETDTSKSVVEKPQGKKPLSLLRENRPCPSVEHGSANPDFKRGAQRKKKFSTLLQILQQPQEKYDAWRVGSLSRKSAKYWELILHSEINLRTSSGSFPVPLLSRNWQQKNC